MKIENFCCAAAELQNKMTGTTKMSQIYYYRSYEEETLSDMLTTGFFNNAQDRVKKDDLIILYHPNTDGNQEIAYSKVVSNIGGVVTITEIPLGAPQVNADWDAVSGVAEILNKPTLGTMAAESASDYTKTEDLATVATTGDYDDLDNKPTIPTVNNSTITLTQSGVTKGSFTLNQPSDDTIDLDAGSGSSRNVGEIIESTLPLTDAGLHLLDGALISGSGSYSAFVTYVAGLVSDYPDCFTTEAAWQQSVTDYGVCGKFVYDSVNNTVRLPKITGIVEGTTDLTALGDLVEAGLPNITGEFNAYSYLTSSAGAIAASRLGNGPSGDDGNRNYNKYNFDASSSSSIYGNSTTVQPQAIKVLYYIVVATATKTEIEVDIDEIATDLNGKADVDLSNMNPSASAKETVVGWGSPDYSAGVSVTTTVNGTYTCPSDGYIIIKVYGYNTISKLTYSSSLDPAVSGPFYGGGVPSSTNLPACFYEYRVQKDEILTCTSVAASPECTFYPCKGAN